MKDDTSSRIFVIDNNVDQSEFWLGIEAYLGNRGSSNHFLDIFCPLTIGFSYHSLVCLQINNSQKLKTRVFFLTCWNVGEFYGLLNPFLFTDRVEDNEHSEDRHVQMFIN